MVFDQIFAQIPDEPFEAITEICDRYLQHEGALEGDDQYQFALKGLAFISAYSEEHGLLLKTPAVQGSPADVDIARHFFTRLLEHQKVKQTDYENFKKSFAKQFGGLFLYEFSDGELERMQALMEEIQDLIGQSDIISKGYQGRLLEKLQKLHFKLYKKVADLDQFWGLAGEGGILMVKFGDGVRPIVERIREMAYIVWRAQIRAESVQGDAKFRLFDNE